MYKFTIDEFINEFTFGFFFGEKEDTNIKNVYLIRSWKIEENFHWKKLHAKMWTHQLYCISINRDIGNN